MEQRILIVEDDLVFRNYLYQVLKYDYDVTAVPGPLEAIRAIQEKSFTLMITDLRMPDMDGRALVEKVHAELDPDMMVIVITAFEDDWPMDQAMSSNVFRYLRKGAFLPSELKQNVDKALEVRGSMVSLSEYRKKADLSDIDEKTRQVEELQTRLRKLTDHAKDMIVWLDAGCTCVYSTAEAERMLGYAPGSLQGTKLSWDDIVYADDRNVVDKFRRLIRERAERDEGEVRVYSGSRQVLHLSYRVFLDYGEHGALAGIDIVAEDITQQKAAEQELKNANSKIQEFNERLAGGVSQKIRALMESEERYKHIVEDSSDIIFSLDGDARIVYMNRKGLSTLGMTPDKVHGIHCGAFITDEASEKRLQEIIGAMNGSAYHEPFDLAIDTPAGRKYYRADLVRIGDRGRPETVCVARDISDDIAKKKRLQLLSNIEHFSVDALIGLDTAGTILSWNRGASAMFGWPEEEALGRDLSIVVPDDAVTEARNMLSGVKSSGPVREHETKWKTRAGDTLDVSVTMNALQDEAGEMFGISAIVVDLTEKKKMETALIQAERLAAMGKLSASIAHEINNPLYGIRSCLNHVLGAEKGAIDHQFVRLAVKETDRIADLIRNMKAFYQPHEGRALEADVAELLREVFILNRKYLEENMVKLVFSPSSAFSIECVPDQVKQVFINVITNAVEAMPDGGELHVQAHPLDDGSAMAVTFRDTGVGIAREDMPQIFDMFYSKKPMVKGVGLGLSVSYGIVKRHGGTLEVSSEEGKGTTVTVTLPQKTPFARQMQLDLT
ncbi:MAG TPA: PAS domain S-box protein [Desulfomonilia bacterium]|nr:PAS domain S-box protein [Desulfomonilia bacterium]